MIPFIQSTWSNQTQRQSRMAAGAEGRHAGRAAVHWVRVSVLQDEKTFVDGWWWWLHNINILNPIKCTLYEYFTTVKNRGQGGVQNLEAHTVKTVLGITTVAFHMCRGGGGRRGGQVRSCGG